MWIGRLAVEGMRRGAPLHKDLGRRAQVGVGPVAIAAADAVDLWRAALDGHVTARVMAALGLGEVAVAMADGLPASVAELRGDMVAAVTEAALPRRVSVEAECQLDPPLFAELRTAALRDPALALGLGARSTLMVRVGWLFSKDGSTATPHVHAVRVGTHDVAANGPERPPWLTALLARVGAKVQRVRPPDEAGLAERLLAASSSPDPELRQRAARAGRAGKDAGIGVIEVVRRDGRLGLGVGRDLLPPRCAAPDALRVASLVIEAIVESPDVLLVDDVPASARRWLGALPETDGAPVEQVWMPALR